MKNVILIVLVLYTFFSCENSGDQATQEITQEIENTISGASCPSITYDCDRNLVLTWIKEVNDSTAYVCFAKSENNGMSFDSTIEIRQTAHIHPHGENHPKIIFKPSGEIIVVWGESNPTPQSKYSGLIYYSQSFDQGKNWSQPIALVKDTSAYDQRYFDMALLPSGEVIAIWLDNRGLKNKEGSTLFCAITDRKNGFKNEKAIAETCCPCCRTDLFVDSKGTIRASYRDIINDSIRDMAHLFSSDGGKTFSLPVRISEDNWVINGCPHTGPTVAENKTGLHFAWYTMGNGEGVFYCNSRDGGKTFSKKDGVSGKGSAKHPQIATLKNNNIAIVWDESAGDTGVFVRLQIRTPDGQTISSRSISGIGAVSEFPVIAQASEKSILIAYSEKKNDAKTIKYRLVAVD
jgi:hypothetical protein